MKELEKVLKELNDKHINIADLEKAYMNEVEYFISEILEDDWVTDKDKEPIKELTESDKRDIVDCLLNDSELNTIIKTSIQYYIYHRKEVLDNEKMVNI